MMAAGHPTATLQLPASVIHRFNEQGSQRTEPQGAAYLMVYTPCQKGFVYETPRSIDLGRLVVECGLYPCGSGTPRRARLITASVPPACGQSPSI